MKVVLITGAAGFLGSHLTDEMLRRGYQVIGFDNLSQGNLRNLESARQNPAFSFHSGDVCDIASLRKALNGQLDMILHLAAFKIPRYGNTSQTLLVNSQGTLNLLELAAERNARFLITSTSDVYGKNPKIPFAEDDDLVLGPSTVARWAYASSKLFDEHLTFALSEERGFSATCVRIFGSYGPRQHLSWWGGPQSVFIDAILNDKILPIHGDGLQTRSFTFVSDTVRGIADAAEADCLNREILNIGNDVEITILELAETIHRLCGVSWPLRLQMLPYNEIAGRTYEDVRRRVPDLRKAKRTIGFMPMVSLEEGLRRTIEWQREITSAVPAVPPADEMLAAAGARG
jgi:UDP-glucose 4-epimerase